MERKSDLSFTENIKNPRSYTSILSQILVRCACILIWLRLLEEFRYGHRLPAFFWMSRINLGLKAAEASVWCAVHEFLLRATCIS